MGRNFQKEKRITIGKREWKEGKGEKYKIVVVLVSLNPLKRKICANVF